MREDMFKIIVEPARKGSRSAAKPKLRLDRCEERSCVTGRRLIAESRQRRKWKRANLSPLKRYLDKQVGRKWDDVHSEVFSNLDAGTGVNTRMQEYLDRFVKTDIWYDRYGMLRCAGEWYYDGDPCSWWTRFYVDPADSILKRTKDLCKSLGLKPRRRSNAQIREDRWTRTQSPYLRKLSATRFHVKLAGVWYEIETKGALVTVYGQRLSPAQIYEDLSTSAWRNHKCWRVTSKLQLNKKTLAKFGLVNDPECKEGGRYG